jgi:hypothetical protein
MIYDTKYVEYHSDAWMNLFNHTYRHPSGIHGTYGWVTWSVDEIVGGIKIAKMIYTKL